MEGGAGLKSGLNCIMAVGEHDRGTRSGQRTLLRAGI